MQLVWLILNTDYIDRHVLIQFKIIYYVLEKMCNMVLYVRIIIYDQENIFKLIEDHYFDLNTVQTKQA